MPPTPYQPPGTGPDQFTLRGLFLAVTLIATALGLFLAASHYVDALIIKIERDAARDRVLEYGSDTEYDRHLLGDEVDSLKAQRKQPPEGPADAILDP